MRSGTSTLTPKPGGQVFRCLQAVLAILVVFCIGWCIKQTVVSLFPGAGLSDFRGYYLSAQHILHGQSPYLALDYIYPPLTAFLFTPLAALDYVPARRTWFVLSHCFLAGAARVLWRRLGANWRRAFVVCLRVGHRRRG